ncbi:bifunctional 2-C-methyl-D-erythritol 4-phosphate cytidylyltransferase/2-C-methyl-D-erythritol 2,4-cyclodiphosphate synthase [Agrococcus lahaulensis]|uniref:bifunctional 2-C-methyl-D-erythritol 4-phosphate cytidylyltransferase/2-C-methyl-D-erythritol 2,4-cyclodiphosphate synthase n=1 Tax=Agrococcus lahaulensis TaxID=341722 RepID=UPI00047D07D2|nr:bifunctional 2-C-methyl-D-erythritol 4-phosphate cytidylyltransferase/2-C-methyl-D-erythritol 2,4-cyclodiphosphate synthase [Agrococcus lahaulensis]
MTDTAIIVVAAGSGTRLGRGVPKAFAELAGATILEHALRDLQWVGALIVVVVPTGYEADASVIAARAGIDALVVAGGATRADSVAAGLEAAGDVRFVLVHDAARALTPATPFSRVLCALAEGAGAVVPVLPVVDTVRAVDGTARSGGAEALQSLGAVVERSGLRAMQTPQGFDAALLRRAYAEAGDARAAATDDAQLVQMLGVEVVSVHGDELAFKITTAADADRAEALLAPEGSGVDELRTGIGVDVHAFGGGGPLMLAGLEWEGQGLAGHSDGDAVCHAIVDALLGAAGLGDIGGLVGVDDPQYAGARGEVFVRRALERLGAEGWAPVNVAVQVLGVRPRIGSRREEAQAALSAMLGAPVSVSGTTTDGLGAIGRGEGVQAIATALIRRR